MNRALGGQGLHGGMASTGKCNGGNSTTWWERKLTAQYGARAREYGMHDRAWHDTPDARECGVSSRRANLLPGESDAESLVDHGAHLLD